MWSGLKALSSQRSTLDLLPESIHLKVMVNPGHPSTGCNRCKERKIKCDSTKPVCMRCTNYGIICPGYDRKVVFKDDTEKVGNRARKIYARLGKQSQEIPSFLPIRQSRKALSRSRSATPDVAATNLTLHNPVGNPTSSSSLVKPALLQGAVGSFLASWSKPLQDVHWGVFSQVSQMYGRGYPHLDASLEAFALIDLSVSEHGRGSNVLAAAMHRYGTALKFINQAMSDPMEQLTDNTIMSIFLITKYERTSHGLTKAGTGLAHFLAIITMLRARGADLVSTSAGRQMLHSTCMIWHAMVIVLPTPIPCPFGSKICKSLGDFELDGHYPSYKLVPLLNRGLLLRRKSLAVLNSLSCLTGQVDDISKAVKDVLQRTLRFETSMHAWYQTLPSNWPRQDDCSAACSLNSWRVHQIFVEDLKVRCYRLLEDCGLEDADMSAKNIALSAQTTRRFVDEMCATTPYSFSPDDPRCRVPYIQQVLPPEVRDVFYHRSFAFPLLVSSMVDAGMHKSQKSGILAARGANARAEGLLSPYRTFPVALVEVGDDRVSIQLCPRCGTEAHYESQPCPVLPTPQVTHVLRRLTALREVDPEE